MLVQRCQVVAGAFPRQSLKISPDLHLLTLVGMSMGNFLKRSSYPFSTAFAAVLTVGVHLFLSVPNVLSTPSIEFPHRATLCCPD